MKALVGAFNQEKALVGAFSVIVQLHRLIDLRLYILHSGSAPARLRHNCQVISNLESASTSQHNNRSQQYIQPNLNNGTEPGNRRQIIQISNRNFRIIRQPYIVQISILHPCNSNQARRVNHLSLFQYSPICWRNIVSMIFLKDVIL